MQFRGLISQAKRIVKNTWYVSCMEKKPVIPGRILLESRKGEELAGNILRLMQAVEGMKDPRYQMYLAVSPHSMEQVKALLRNYHVEHVTLTEFYGMHYFELLATAEYLINDTTFPRRFIKRNGQKYLNVWHGTPFKKMGKDVPGAAHVIGNIQKNFLMADMLFYPSDYMRKKMISAYNLENLYEGTYVYGGYPRNQVFYDDEARSRVKDAVGLSGKRIYCYMPTWRGGLAEECKGEKLEKQVEVMRSCLEKLDVLLTDSEVLFLRLHHYVGQRISCGGFRHIRPFPEGYEPYDILNLADCLVTDYSSVFFDYANKKDGKIILFLYDRKEYKGERDFYMEPESLPFPIVENAEKLVEELRSPAGYDSRKFLETHCTYDGAGAAEKLCRFFLEGTRAETIRAVRPVHDGRKKLLFYVGGMRQNGMTSAFLNLMENVDPGQYDYYVCFQEEYLREIPGKVKLFPEFLKVFPMSSGWELTVCEGLACVLYYKLNLDNAWIRRMLGRFYSREYRRTFGGCRLDWCIHYTGYERKVISMFLKAPGKRAIFVHNDMEMEARTKKNQHLPTLRTAYANYDLVIAVSRDIYEKTMEISGKKDNLHVIYNWYPFEKIRKRAKENWEFGSETGCTLSKEELERFLLRSGRRMISVGRFSPEKQHWMLLEAFAAYHKEHGDSTLVIIGGGGELYEQTWEKAKALGLEKNVALIRSLENPMPILKTRDLFVLSSAYEGMPVSLFEANSLGIPAIATDVVGTRGFLREHGGYLTPATVQGLLEGMNAFDRGEVHLMDVDYKAFNLENLERLTRLLDA